MPKLYETFKVAAEVGKEKYADTGITSTEAEKKKVVACFPDDSLVASDFLATLELAKKADFHIDNLAGEASKRIIFDLEVPMGRTFKVGYRAGAAEDGDKYVTVEYEIIG